MDALLGGIGIGAITLGVTKVVETAAAIIYSPIPFLAGVLVYWVVHFIGIGTQKYKFDLKSFTDAFFMCVRYTAASIAGVIFAVPILLGYVIVWAIGFKVPVFMGRVFPSWLFVTYGMSFFAASVAVMGIIPGYTAAVVNGVVIIPVASEFLTYLLGFIIPALRSKKSKKM